MQTKVEAQRRADQINAFRKELDLVEADGILVLDARQKEELNEYHDELLGNFSSSFDIDVDVKEKQLSLGMRIASFLGALAFGASLFFLFYQFWGYFPTATQVVILFLAPLSFLGLTYLISRRDRTGYFVKISGLLCVAAFVLNLVMFGQIFNLESSNQAFLVWSVLALLLAYASDARLLVAAGVIAFGGFLSAQVGTWSGCYWLHFGMRPENFIPAGCILFLAGFLSHQRYSQFSSIYRVFGLLFVFFPILILANWGRGSYLVHNFSFSVGLVENFYQITGFVFSAAVTWLGVLKRWSDASSTGNVFFVVLLYTKFFDWWWDVIPKYLFFLIIGLTSLLFLLVFRRLRVRKVEGRL